MQGFPYKTQKCQNRNIFETTVICAFVHCHLYSHLWKWNYFDRQDKYYIFFIAVSHYRKKI